MSQTPEPIFPHPQEVREATGTHTISESAKHADARGSVGSSPEILRAATRVVCRLGPESRMVSLSQEPTPAAEKFRILRHTLCRLRERRSLKSLLVTSAIPEEGKTVVAGNLAVTLALNSSKVLLIDADLRAPEGSRLFRLPPLPGLADCLDGRIEFEAALRFLDPLNIHFLPAGSNRRNPVELLQSPRAKSLMEQAAAAFDWIVLDSPPVNPFADAHCLACRSDGVLLVARVGFTPRECLQQALAALDGIFVAGVVLNAADDPSSDSYYRYYYYAPARGHRSGSAPQGRT